MMFADLNRDEWISLILISITILILKYVLYKILTDVNYFKDLSLNKKSQSFFKSDLPPVFPNGWIPVANSSFVKREIYQAILCGNDIILFRDENSEIVCLDAYCPHLGANLAFGGYLFENHKQTCLKCPFHGWSFDKNGKCIDIPYNCSKAIPNGTSIKSYSVRELNDFVYVWYHADDEPPNYYPELIEEIKLNNWKFMGRTEHLVSCHYQEIAENGADISHLNAIHKDSVLNGSNVCNQSWISNWINKFNYHDWHAEYDLTDDEVITRINNRSLNGKLLNGTSSNGTSSNGTSSNGLSDKLEFDKNKDLNDRNCSVHSTSDKSFNQTKQSHACRIFLRKRTFFFSFNVFEMNLNVKQIGPSIVHLKFKSRLLGFYEIEAAFIQGIQPIEPFKHRITHQFYSKDGFIHRILSKLFLYGEAKMIERDIYVWNRKKFLKKPFILASEKSIAKYRRWFLQFYSPKSPTVESLRNGLDW